MKKLLIMLVVFFSISLFAESMYLAPKLQLGYGFGDAHDAGGLTVNPGFGGGVIFGYQVMPELAVEANLSFEYWLTDPSDLKVMNIPITVGANYKFNEMVGGIAGLGFRMNMYSLEVGGVSLYDETYKDFGFYAGADINFSDFFVRPSFNYYIPLDDGPENDMYILVELGYKFGL